LTHSPKRQRLDQVLVERGLVRTRSRARDIILRGDVRVDGAAVTKPSQMVVPCALLDIAQDATRYVSRGAFKLIAALDAFGFDPQGRTVLDIGASTGGFTQVLLERGASHVTAVDVGREQLAEEVSNDDRVTALEATDARNLNCDNVRGGVTAIVADVSFISLIKALPKALELASSGCWLVALIKPQFEAGRDAIGKGGIVRDEAARQQVVEGIQEWLEGQSGWRVTGVITSPIEGGDGNVEFLIGARYGE